MDHSSGLRYHLTPIFPRRKLVESSNETDAEFKTMDLYSLQIKLHLCDISSFLAKTVTKTKYICHWSWRPPAPLLASAESGAGARQVKEPPPRQLRAGSGHVTRSPPITAHLRLDSGHVIRSPPITAHLRSYAPSSVNRMKSTPWPIRGADCGHVTRSHVLIGHLLAAAATRAPAQRRGHGSLKLLVLGRVLQFWYYHYLEKAFGG